MSLGELAFCSIILLKKSLVHMTFVQPTWTGKSLGNSLFIIQYLKKNWSSVHPLSMTLHFMHHAIYHLLLSSLSSESPSESSESPVRLLLFFFFFFLLLLASWSDKSDFDSESGCPRFSSS